MTSESVLPTRGGATIDADPHDRVFPAGSDSSPPLRAEETRAMGAIVPNDPKAVASIVQVTAAIIVDDGNILIAQRHPEDRLGGLWEFPGGKIEAGETPQACLKRELWEELKMVAVIGEALGSTIYHYAHLTIELMAFRAFWNGAPFSLITHQASRWVPPERLVDYPFTPADLPFVRRLSRGAIALA